MKLVSTGIKGLDWMLGGGIPQGYLVSVIGSCGTGKTTLGLHFIYEGLKNGEKCLVISFDEDEAGLIQTAEGYGMNFSAHSDDLLVVRLDAEEVKKKVEGFEDHLKRIFETIKPLRVLIDPLTILETLFDDAGRYSFLAKIRGIVKAIGATGIITGESNIEKPSSSKFGIMEYVSDGIIVLKTYRENELEEAILSIEIIKMRRVNHQRKPRPFTISNRGIEVFEESELM